MSDHLMNVSTFFSVVWSDEKDQSVCSRKTYGHALQGKQLKIIGYHWELSLMYKLLEVVLPALVCATTALVGK